MAGGVMFQDCADAYNKSRSQHCCSRVNVGFYAESNALSPDASATGHEAPYDVILNEECSQKTYIMKLTIQEIPFLLFFTIANKFLVHASQSCPSDPGMSPTWLKWPGSMSLTLGREDRIVTFSVIANVTCSHKEKGCCRKWANKVRAQQAITPRIELRL